MLFSTLCLDPDRPLHGIPGPGRAGRGRVRVLNRSGRSGEELRGGTAYAETVRREAGIVRSAAGSHPDHATGSTPGNRNSGRRLPPSAPVPIHMVIINLHLLFAIHGYTMHGHTLSGRRCLRGTCCLSGSKLLAGGETACKRKVQQKSRPCQVLSVNSWEFIFREYRTGRDESRSEVPAHYRRGALVPTECAHCGGAEGEVPAHFGRQSQPACGQHAQEMPVCHQ